MYRVLLNERISWVSKNRRYENPCSVTGTGDMQAQSKHLKTDVKIELSERGKLTTWRLL